MNTATASPMKTDPTEKLLTFSIPLLMLVSFSLLAAEPELRLAVPLLVGTTAFTVVLLAITLYKGEVNPPAWSPAFILGFGLLLRLLFLFSPPQLSDDLYRYLWDGWNLLHGTNPYALPPAEVTPPAAMATVYSLINHPQYVTIYPPAAQLIFAAGSALGGTVTGLKVFLAAVDLGLCGLLIAVLRRLRLPPWQSVLYAWNPLPVIEIAGSGHVDGAGLTLLLGSLLLLFPEKEGGGAGKRRIAAAGALFAGATLVKLFPLVLLPALLLTVPKGRRLCFVAACAGTGILLLIPFLPHLRNLAGTLAVYAGNWEFAGGAFSSLRALTGSGGAARWIVSGTFVIAGSVVTLRLFRRIGCEPAAVIRHRQAMSACYAIATALLLLTPTLQPWYALALAVFLPFAAGPAGIVLCWTVFLTYQVQIPYFILGKWVENPWVTAAVALAPATAFLLGRVFSAPCRTNRSPA